MCLFFEKIIMALYIITVFIFFNIKIIRGRLGGRTEGAGWRQAKVGEMGTSEIMSTIKISLKKLLLI